MTKYEGNNIFLYTYQSNARIRVLQMASPTDTRCQEKTLVDVTGVLCHTEVCQCFKCFF